MGLFDFLFGKPWHRIKKSKVPWYVKNKLKRRFFVKCRNREYKVEESIIQFVDADEDCNDMPFNRFIRIKKYYCRSSH